MTFVAFVLVLFFGEGESFETGENRMLVAADLWYQGLWNGGGFSFAMQMMLMLLLGHVVALSKPIEKFLTFVISGIHNLSSAAFFVTILTIVVSLFNWGLGLIFGALFARKVAEKASKENWDFNYGLIGACGYVGLMVWHGGLSGSAPIKVADDGHLAALMNNSDLLEKVPVSIPMSDTIFSTMNILVTVLLLIVLPLFAFFLSKKVKTTKIVLNTPILNETQSATDKIGIEKLDSNSWFGRFLGILIIIYAFIRVFSTDDAWSLKFLTPDFINFGLLAAALLFHGSMNAFLGAIDKAIGGVGGILIQFPLYYGIMSLMQNGGILTQVAQSISHVTGEVSFPLLTLASSGLMNIFVPSGGGQWVVQGPVIIESALSNGVPLSKSVMAMAYGDQLTNMLQPFWALPLLAITNLKAKELIPYTLLFMLVGTLIFILGLILF